jgi:hypothetical protein
VNPSALPGVLIVLGVMFGAPVVLTFVGHWGGRALKSAAGRRLQSWGLWCLLLLPTALEKLDTWGE